MRSVLPLCRLVVVEWHPSEVFPKVGFIVTNLPMEPDWAARFDNQRCTAEPERDGVAV